MAHDVFISYASNNQQAANAICHVLEEHGVRCWMAPRNLVSEQQISEEIDQAIVQCKVFMLLFCDESQKSKWIRAEVNVAFDSGRLIVPIKLDETLPIGPLRIMLVNKHWLDVFPNPQDRFSDIVDLVKGTLNRGSDSVLTGSVQEPKVSIERKKGVFSKIFQLKVAHLSPNADCDVYIDGAKRFILKSGDMKPLKPIARKMLVEVVSKKYPKAKFTQMIDFDSLTVLKSIVKLDVRNTEKRYLLFESGEKESANINSLGQIYLEERQFDDALACFSKAAQKGEAAAYYNIGMMYHFGEGVEIDLQTAVEYYEKALARDDNYPLALNNLASLYYHGAPGVEIDYVKAFPMFLRSAEQGIAVSQHTVGFMYLFKMGVDGDLIRAKQWLELSAKNGVKEAHNILSKWRDEPKTGLVHIELEYDNGTYIGTLNSKSRKTGRGILRYNDGKIYDGEWIDDESCGYGVLTFANGEQYEGLFENGYFHGKGKYSFPSGDFEDGQYVDGEMSGFGIYHFSNGHRYEGEFRNDAFHGRGIYYYKDGTSHTGEWANGKKILNSF